MIAISPLQFNCFLGLFPEAERLKRKMYSIFAGRLAYNESWHRIKVDQVRRSARQRREACMYRNLTVKDFSRQDEADDANFYAMPRMVVHLDDKAVSLVKDITRRYMPPMQVRVLDLMSSFRSHLPEDRPYREVIGLGMNQSEMQANPQLTRFLVHDLNRSPQLPFPTGNFDLGFNTVPI